MKLQSLILALTFCLLAASSARARSINWGGAVANNLYESNGSIMDSIMVFEVGSFGSSFLPTEFNMDQWLTNWKVFDRAVDGAGWNPGAQFFSSTANLLTNGTSSASPPLPSYTFAQGEQGYIWAYKTDQDYKIGLEWALITNDSSNGTLDDWIFPPHSDQTSLPLQWRLSTATTPIFGALNNVQGPGEHTSTPVSVNLQTHAIPEPASSLFIGIASLIPLLSRRRKARSH